MSHYVNVSWIGAGKVRDRVTYDSHREEPLPGGQTRELRGIGNRYRALRGDEAAVLKQLEADGRDFRTPLHARGKLTVDDATAERIARLNPVAQQRAMQDAVDKTFNSAWRDAQGVYVLHFHGGRNRPSGHPHVHFVLSAREVGGGHSHLDRERLARFKDAWSREIDRAIDRQLARQARQGPDREGRPERDAPGTRARLNFENGAQQPAREARAKASAQQRNVLPILRGYYMARGAMRHPLRFAVNLAVRVGARALVHDNRGGVLKAAAARFHGGQQNAKGRPSAPADNPLLRQAAAAIVARSFRHLTNAVPLAVRAPARVAYSIFRSLR